MKISDVRLLAAPVSARMADFDVRVTACLLLFVIALVGCGGGGASTPGGSTPAPIATTITVTTSPSNVSAFEGGAVSFMAGVQIMGNASFQWLRDGVAIPGATSMIYALPAVTLGDNGAQFSLQITGANGATVFSGSATLTVTATPLNFELQPANTIGQQGGTATLSANVSGHAPFTLQWQRSDDGGANWHDLANGNEATLTIEKLTMKDAANYRLVASNAVATTQSAVVTLTVLPNLRLLAGAVGGAGYVNGPLGEARFDEPGDVVVATDDSIIVVQQKNTAIRKIAADGMTSTYVDGSVYNTPGTNSQLAMDANGYIYFSKLHAVYKMLPDGKNFSRLAGGTDYQQGLVDGQGDQARFLDPSNLVLDDQQNLIVADASNGAIRKITPAGMVTTLIGANPPDSEHTIHGASGIALGDDGALFVSDQYDRVIRRVSPAGTVTVVAGQLKVWGAVDGPAGVSQLRSPGDLAFDRRSHLLYIADGNTVRMLDASGGLGTLAGQAMAVGAINYADGARSAARFGSILGITLDNSGNVIVSDQQNNTVRRITPAGLVSTVSGVGPVTGAADGQGANARFSLPTGIVRAHNGDLYVADTDNHVIRKVDARGNVALFAGVFGDATVLPYPQHLVIDSADNLYVTAGNYPTVYKIKSNGAITLLAQKDASGNVDGAGISLNFDYVSALSIDGADNLYILQNRDISKITPARVITTLATFGALGYQDGPANVATFSYVRTLAADATGNVYISDNCLLRKIAPDGAVTTVAGRAGFCGAGDGLGSSAYLAPARSMAVGPQGDIFVADETGLRQISPAGYVKTLIRSFSGYGINGARVVEHNGALSYANITGGVAFMPDGGLIMVSENAILLTE